MVGINYINSEIYKRCNAKAYNLTYKKNRKLKMNLRIIIFLILISLCSCNNQKRQENLISNNKVKYWDMVSPRLNSRSRVRGYCFHKNGTFEYFLYYEDKRYRDGANDIELDMSWKCLNDSILILGGKKVRILKLTKESFIFQLSNKSVYQLKISENQIDTVIPEHHPYN